RFRTYTNFRTRAYINFRGCEVQKLKAPEAGKLQRLKASEAKKLQSF
ncbi:hypothetical protein A2U01_0071924, partial [Trifolium medium]|nr:hypothetical protein [Trifolium medium]